MLKSSHSRSLVIYGCFLHRNYSCTSLLSRLSSPKSSSISSYKLNQSIVSQNKVRYLASCSASYGTGNSNVNCLNGSNQPPYRSFSSEAKTVDTIDLTFRDTKQAYKSKTTYELLRAIFVLKISQFDIIVFNHAIVSHQSQLNSNWFIHLLLSPFDSLPKLDAKFWDKRCFTSWCRPPSTANSLLVKMKLPLNRFWITCAPLVSSRFLTIRQKKTCLKTKSRVIFDCFNWV